MYDLVYTKKTRASVAMVVMLMIIGFDCLVLVFIGVEMAMRN
jgi:hypothetical protein